MTPTAEQQAIIDAARTSRENILISALAGAAKTTTLGMIARALPGQPILSIAFNKRIAEEMKTKLPPHVSSATLNSVGHRAFAAFANRKLVVESRKTYNILKELTSTLKGAAKEEAFETFTETLHAVSKAKLQGYLPADKFIDRPHPLSLDDFQSNFDEPLSYGQLNLVSETLVRSVKQAFDGTIDFDDQIFMSTIFGGVFPRFPITMVDEAQDLSPLNILMLQKLVGDRRLFAVGDRNQSIYAFRSASTKAMDEIKSTFSMTEMTLSTSFRCAQTIVELARKRAPSMQWAEGAPLGHIEILSEWSAETIKDGAAIICRNNAPLMKAAFALLKAGRGVTVVGKDLGPQLVKTLKKLGPESMSQIDTLLAIDRWQEAHLAKARGKASVSDRADCLRVFANFGRTLGEAITYCEHIFSREGPIQLLSGHKSKGLEFDTVYHLDPWRIPSQFAKTEEEFEQEENLNYVITTRAKLELFFIDLENFK